MSDIHGLERAREMGVTLRAVGHRIVFENEYVRIWEVSLAPGETHEFHIHYHPYVVISLCGGESEVQLAPFRLPGVRQCRRGQQRV